MVYMVLNIVSFALMLLLFINMIIQFIRLVKTVQQQAYDPNTEHTFQCKKCQFTHDLNGEQFKALRWKTRVRIETPFGQSTGIRFQCPNCHQKARQIIQYDYNVTKGLGMMRLQMNKDQKGPLIRFAVLGFLPMIVGMALIQMIRAVVETILGLFS